MEQKVFDRLYKTSLKRYMPEKPDEPKHTPLVAAQISDNFYQYNMLKQELKRKDCERKKKFNEDLEKERCTFSPDIRTWQQQRADSKATRKSETSRLQNEAIQKEIALL